MAFVHFGHVLAALLAAIHVLMPGRAALLGNRLSWSRRGRLGSGNSRRCNQNHHGHSPEFEKLQFESQERLGGGVAVSGCRPESRCTDAGITGSHMMMSGPTSGPFTAGSDAAHAIVHSAKPPLPSCWLFWSGQFPIGISTVDA